MPELPEVEVVRRGLAPLVTGRVVTGVEVLHPRAVRRHVAGGDDLVARLAGGRITGVRRRGKYLWLSVSASGGRAERLVAHLGMSGQLLLVPPGTPDQVHLRVRVALDGDPPLELRFVDQRTFGGLFLSADPDPPAGVPPEIAHIAPDPIGAEVDAESLFNRLRRKRTGLKRALLDQTVLSGVGNIYGDEALWRARLHPDRPTGTLTRAEVASVLTGLREVMTAALAAGGTSFDSLYVNVNGSSGRFDRSLHAYGRTGQPCERCGTPIVREPFMNRSSHRCPLCQPAPKRRPAARGVSRAQVDAAGPSAPGTAAAAAVSRRPH